MIETDSFLNLIETIIDNRGKTCPTSPDGIPLIATNCVKNSTLYPTFEKIRFVDEATMANWFRGHPEPGDILFVCKGSPGQTCLVPDPVSFCIAQDMVSVRANRTKVYPAYLFAALRSSLVQSQIQNMHVGTMIPHFKKGDFDKLRIPVPDDETQKRIGDLYFEISKKIDLNRQMNETLEASARALFRDWFIDFGPTKAKMAGDAPYLASDLWSLFPNGLDPDGIPSGWMLGDLSELVKFNPRERLTKGTRAPYIDMAALPTSGSTIEGVKYREFKSGSKFRIGDTLMARITPCLENGKTGYVDCLDHNVVGAGSTEFFVLRAHDPIPPEFAYLIARDRSFRAVAIQSMSGTSGRQRATKEALESYSFVQPNSKTIWKEFGKMASPLFARITANRRENATLSETRDLLLPKLMSGEIRIGEAEKTVSEIA